MTKAKRIKTTAPVIGDLPGADKALRELAELERSTGAINLRLNDEIDRLKERAKADIAPMEARKKELVQALAAWLSMCRQEVLRDKKSLELTFGTVGFRQSTSIRQRAGVSQETTLERLKEMALIEGIRTREEIDKDALRGWPAERLALVGLVRREEDRFFVEIKEEFLK